MDADVKVIIFNKGASVSTVTYNNWTDGTSRSIKVIGGDKITTYNWYEADHDNPGDYITVFENILGLEVTPFSAAIVTANFGYDTDQVSIKISTGSWTQ